MSAASPCGAPPPAVLRCGDVPRAELRALLARYGLGLRTVAGHCPVPGSYWGDEEAGLIDATVYARADTPLHSVLHEACHVVCMTPRRRAGLHTDAGGSDAEENAVCYLQIVLTDFLSCSDRDALCADMDAWGYSFRLGSAARWFRDDADDARAWLRRHGLLNADGTPSWRKRAGEAPP